MGLNGDFKHPEVLKCMDHVIDVAQKKGIPLCATLYNSDVKELKADAAVFFIMSFFAPMPTSEPLIGA